MKVFLNENKVAIQLYSGDDFQSIIQKIKDNLSPYEYSPQTKLWTTEKMNLLVFQQIFNNEKIYYGEGVLQLLEKQKQYLEQLEVDKNIPYNDQILLLKNENLKLFDHQKKAINYLLKYPSSGLFDEQGLGKTLTVISVLCILFDQKKIDNVIIFCPNTLKFNWARELELFSSLTFCVLHGDRKERLQQLAETKQIYITNYESLAIKKTKVKEKTKAQKTAEEFQDSFTNLITSRTSIILDEAHRIKSGNSKISKYIRKIGKLAEYKYTLTGTPIANKPEDIFYLMMFLDDGKLLGTNYWQFLKQYCILGNHFSEYAIVGYKNLDKLKFLINLKSLRRLKDDVLDLPEKIYEEKIIEPTREHLMFYNKLKAEVLQIITKEGDLKRIEPYLIRLIQASSNPLLIDPETKIVGSKVSELDNLLTEHIELSGNKVVVWTNFVNNYPYLLERYKKYNPVYINGSVDPKARQDCVEQFQTNPEVKLIICNPQAAKEGITLTASSVSIYLDRTFNLVDWKQSNDRIHRIGQNKRCLIITLLCKDSIDEIISKNIYKKSEIAAFLQGDIDSIQKIDNKAMIRECIKQLML